jgi:hypothetical protein
MNYLMTCVLALLTGILWQLARTEPDRRKARRLYAVATATALAVLAVAFIPALPHLVH